MSEEASKQRSRRAKKRAFRNLCDLYRYVAPFPEPVHYYCSENNTFVRVEIDEIQSQTKEVLKEFKGHCSLGAIVQIYLYKKGIHKPELIKINDD